MDKTKIYDASEIHDNLTKEVMKDVVLHETGKINLFGLAQVNPALISVLS